ncbi:uracil-DNA glycosylase [soil metagenome]
MADSPEIDWNELRRIAQGHLDSLKAAGVEWLPVGPPLEARVLPAFSQSQATQDPSGATDSMANARPPAGANLFETTDASQAANISPEDRRQQLILVAERVKTCTRCPELASTRTQTVFGVGPVDAELCLVGEAPGADEDREGVPFVGRAGQLLDKILAACGLKREEVYICNILRCRPPGNRTPLPDEAAHCREYLDAQLALVQPKYICALGACAAQNLLGTTQSIGRLRGQFHRYKDIPVFCTYHPSYLLRSPEKKRDVWEDMQVLMKHMGRTLPPRSGIGEQPA